MKLSDFRSTHGLGISVDDGVTPAGSGNICRSCHILSGVIAHTGQMLKFGLYLPSSSESEISSWNSEHDRIWKIPSQMNPAKFVRDWWAYDGKTLITGKGV